MGKRKVTIKKTNWRPIILTLVFLIIAALLILSTVRLFAKYKKARGVYQETKLEYDNLTEMKASLEESVELLSTDEGIARELREKLRVVGEGEELIIIVPEEEVEERSR